MNFEAKTPQDVRRFRTFGVDGYLKYYQKYWHEAVDLALLLIAKAGVDDLPYQQYEDAFILQISKASLESSDVQPYHANNPSSDVVGQAIAELREKPRGAQHIVYFRDDGAPAFQSYIHCGGGKVLNLYNLATVAGQYGSMLPGHYALLKFEAFYARKEAAAELAMLKNFETIRLLALCPGLELLQVEFKKFGDHLPRRADFVIRSITPNGFVLLDNIKPHSDMAFIVLPASQITIENCKIDAVIQFDK
jgi:hypothetical protein